MGQIEVVASWQSKSLLKQWSVVDRCEEAEGAWNYSAKVGRCQIKVGAKSIESINYYRSLYAVEEDWPSKRDDQVSRCYGKAAGNNRAGCAMIAGGRRHLVGVLLWYCSSDIVRRMLLGCHCSSDIVRVMLWHWYRQAVILPPRLEIRLNQHTALPSCCRLFCSTPHLIIVLERIHDSAIRQLTPKWAH